MIMGAETITLQRDCGAIQIPSGQPVSFAAGDAVNLVQSLGGSFAVICNGTMARIEGRDADALGMDLPKSDVPSNVLPSSADGCVNEEAIWSAMRTCYDPEIPVNIVDLGLIYDCCVKPLPEKGHLVQVKMTLTAPGCGMSDYLKADLETKIREIPGVTDVQVEVVWDPPWNQAMMTDAARLELGLM